MFDSPKCPNMSASKSGEMSYNSSDFCASVSEFHGTRTFTIGNISDTPFHEAIHNFKSRNDPGPDEVTTYSSTPCPSLGKPVSSFQYFSQIYYLAL